MIWVISGAESCGKTTLASQLAEHFGWRMFEENARNYLTEKNRLLPQQQRYRYLPSDLLTLAQDQVQQDLNATELTHCIFDTDLLTLIVWWQEKYGPLPEFFNEAWMMQMPRFYLLCRPDLPWQADPLREHPMDRDRLFDRYVDALEQRRCRYAICDGLDSQRKANAIRIIEQSLSS